MVAPRSALTSAALVHHGNCIDWLRSLDTDSVDAFVTDPPYELTAKSRGGSRRMAGTGPFGRHRLDTVTPVTRRSLRKGPDNCLANLLGPVGVDGDADRPESGGGDDRIPVRVSSLLSPPPVLGPVELQNEAQVRQEEVNGEPAPLVLEDVLMDRVEADPGEHLPNVDLVLRKRQGFAGCVGVCSCYSEAGDSTFRVPVWVSHDPARETESPPELVAGKGAVVRAVLRLDLRRGTAELLPADGALQANPTITLVSAQGVRARAGAGGLAPVLQSDGLGLVDDPADGAGSVFGLRLHRDSRERLDNPIVARGGFMGKLWDGTGIAHDPEFWAEVYRVMKPGAHLVSFAGTRTAHRMTCAIEDVGFEVRDVIHWLYYSGFPKSLDVSKAIGAAAGASREVVGRATGGIAGGTGDHAGTSGAYGFAAEYDITAPATPEAQRWNGWGTALKPSIEPAVLARKPLERGLTVAANVLKWGTGAINIDACRITPGDLAWPGPNDAEQLAAKHASVAGLRAGNGYGGFGDALRTGEAHPGGYWPANVYYHPKPSRRERERGLSAESMLCSCSDTRAQWDEEDRKASMSPETGARARRAITGSTSEDASEWPMSSSGSDTTDPSPRGSRSTTSTRTSKTTRSGTSDSSIASPTSASTPDASSEMACGGNLAGSAESGSPSTPTTGTSPGKDGPSMDAAAPVTSPESSSKSGGVVPGIRVCPKCGRWDQQPKGSEAVNREEGSAGTRSPRAGSGRTARAIWCVHPTVKPVGLMRWLCRLVTPPGGKVRDPFLGSGTTGIAAVLEGFDFEGAEREAEYVAIARARLDHALRHPEEWEPGARPKRKRKTSVVEVPAQVALFGGSR